ncbi:hypothetical protein WN48_05379 [Eufriesea mexicana]|nr:hypothetical protein WN48_05379 [Eufriesea mexicana]
MIEKTARMQPALTQTRVKFLADGKVRLSVLRPSTGTTFVCQSARSNKTKRNETKRNETNDYGGTL